MLALATHPERRWEHQRIPLRIFSIAGRLTCSVRRTMLHVAARARAGLLPHALITLRELAAPG